VAVSANGHVFDRGVFVCFEKPSHRCSAGVGQQAFPDALIGVELPVHNRCEFRGSLQHFGEFF